MKPFVVRKDSERFVITFDSSMDLANNRRHSTLLTLKNHRLYQEVKILFVERYSLDDSAYEQYHKLLANIQRIYRKGKIVRCSDCDSYVLTRNSVEVSSDRKVCQDCAKTYQTCDMCGGFYRSGYWERGYCSHCYTRCAHCNDLILQSDSETVSDDFGSSGVYCRSCADEAVIFCNDCDSIVMSYNWEEHEENCGMPDLRSYGNPPVHFYKTEKESDRVRRFFGIELEAEMIENRKTCLKALKREIDSLGGRFWIKRDGSLHNGMEFPSHPMTLKAWLEFKPTLQIALSNLIDSGWRSHDTNTCGLHVHVSRDSATLETWAKIALFWYSHDNFIQSLCRRKNNDYCYKKNVKGYMENREICEDDSRYYAINFTNPHTVEFRQARGTLNTETIINWIIFIDSLISWAKNKNNTYLESQESEVDFINWIKNEGKHTLANYIENRLNKEYSKERC